MYRKPYQEAYGDGSNSDGVERSLVTPNTHTDGSSDTAARAATADASEPALVVSNAVVLCTLVRVAELTLLNVPSEISATNGNVPSELTSATSFGQGLGLRRLCSAAEIPVVIAAVHLAFVRPALHAARRTYAGCCRVRRAREKRDGDIECDGKCDGSSSVSASGQNRVRVFAGSGLAVGGSAPPCEDSASAWPAWALTWGAALLLAASILACAGWGLWATAHMHAYKLDIAIAHQVISKRISLRPLP